MPQEPARISQSASTEDTRMSKAGSRSRGDMEAQDFKMSMAAAADKPIPDSPPRKQRANIRESRSSPPERTKKNDEMREFMESQTRNMENSICQKMSQPQHQFASEVKELTTQLVGKVSDRMQEQIDGISHKIDEHEEK